MQLGMPALIEFKSLEENFRLCADLGLDFVEVNLNLPYCSLDKLVAFVANRHDMLNGKGITIHLPEEIDLANHNTSIRAGYLKCIQECMDAAVAIKAGVLNLHVKQGVYFTMPDRKVWVNEQYLAESVALFNESLAVINAGIRDADYKFCFENEGINTFAEACYDAINRYDSLYYTWDVGHDALSGFRASAIMERNMRKVGHMHLHDYDEKKNHNELFTGKLDVRKYIGYAQQHDFNVVIEVKTEAALTNSVRRLRA